ncbi:MAG: hypothetical protein IPK82_38400 [Polyangiaceae bacterium]|nr:hypothetical protein [Polyangiaceae bacterium]
MALDPETRRYLEHFQRKLLRPDFDKWVEHKDFVVRMTGEAGRTMRQRFGPNFSPYSDALIREYEKELSDFVPATSYDTATSHLIFGDIMDQVQRSLQDMQRPLQRPVRLATSTDANPSPASVPSQEEHLLFIGEGTSFFCNYWAKFLSHCLTEGALSSDGPAITAPDMDKFFHERGDLTTIFVELLLHYAFFGHLFGFGVLIQPAHSLRFRLELLRAMEVFVVGHEFGHFYLEENPRSLDPADPLRQMRLEEHFCDQFGFIVCRYFGTRTDSWFAFSGAAPLMFLSALRLCENARAHLSTRTAPKDTHPPVDDRIGRILYTALNDTHADNLLAVRGYLEEVGAMWEAMERIARDIFELAGAQSGESHEV